MRLLQVLSVCVLFGAIPAMIQAQEKKKSIYDFQVTTIDGQKIDLAKYKGKVIVIVNVASECGYTGQYKALQELHAKYGKDGLAILAFPCNDFGKQEPDNEAKIKDFAKKNYGVQFDLFSKVKILGKDSAPLFKFLTSKEGNPTTKSGDVKWNFEKFIFGRDGVMVARFLSDVEPDSKDFTDVVKKQLATK